jgi:hypothetical protein
MQRLELRKDGQTASALGLSEKKPDRTATISTIARFALAQHR